LNILIIISRFSQGKQSKQKSRIKGTNILYSAVIRKTSLRNWKQYFVHAMMFTRVP